MFEPLVLLMSDLAGWLGEQRTMHILKRFEEYHDTLRRNLPVCRYFLKLFLVWLPFRTQYSLLPSLPTLSPKAALARFRPAFLDGRHNLFWPASVAGQFHIQATVASDPGGIIAKIYASRAISGVGLGSISTVALAYVSECSPKDRITGIFQIMVKA